VLPSQCFLDLNEGITDWGWTNGPFSTPIDALAPVWREAENCDVNQGTNVGTLNINFIDGVNVDMTFIMNPGYTLAEVYLNVSPEIMPRQNKNFYTTNTAKFGYKDSDAGDVSVYSHSISVADLNGGDFYVVARTLVCGNNAV
jgi:hypothetical protein